ncbi:hypothetical protein [Campylobacter troglodytis]|uniref:hypothetical protein n=1 Tax=Campylobacter troglodytis TaxID=654363 RepID=UPI0011576C4E|nr:hypothetical protein DMC01_10920 [Campylobacter troglodytis]
MNLELKNGAFLIADAHENEQRQGFLKLLKALESGDIQTPQLILMGDIFEILVGEISKTHDFVAPYITLLESLATKDIEVLYIEGNHDFNLAKIFKNVRVFSLENQPLSLKCPLNLRLKRAKFSGNSAEFKEKGLHFKKGLEIQASLEFKEKKLKDKGLEDQNIDVLNKDLKGINSQLINTQSLANENSKATNSQNAEFKAQSLEIQAQVIEFQAQVVEFKGISKLRLAHGDIFLPPFLAFLLKSLRNPFLLKTLNLINKLSFNVLLNKIKSNQKKKNLFYKIDNFELLAKQRYDKYKSNNALIIEGHYHQDALFNTDECKYINLPTFAYERSFFVVECV